MSRGEVVQDIFLRWLDSAPVAESRSAARSYSLAYYPHGLWFLDNTSAAILLLGELFLSVVPCISMCHQIVYA